MSTTERKTKLWQRWNRLSFIEPTYICGKTVKNVVINRDGTKKAPKRLQMWIIARQHYYEIVKDYPIANTRELRQVLHNEPVFGPFNGTLIQHIQPLNENSTRVTSWVLDDESLPPPPSAPILLIPETALLPKDRKAHQYNHPKGTLCYFDSPEGIRSTVINSNENERTVTEAMGIPVSNEEGKKFPIESLEEALTDGIYRLTLSNILTYWVLKREIGQPFQWKRAAFLSTGIIGVYLASTSLGLLGYNQYLNWKIKDQSQATEAAIQLRHDLRKKREKSKYRADLIGREQQAWHLWTIVVQMIKTENIELNSMKYHSGEALIFGEASRATDILEKITKYPKVKKASFAQPVRKGPRGESFSIRLTPAVVDETKTDA